MNTALWLFYSLVIIAVASALSMLITKNILYKAYLLMIVLLSIAGIYLIIGAEFLAATQIVVYVGGVLVLIIFGLMFTKQTSGKNLRIQTNNLLQGIVSAVAIFISAVFVIWSINFESLTWIKPMLSTPPPNTNQVNQIGINLMGSNILVFELTGIFLLLVLVGSTFLAWNKKNNT